MLPRTRFELLARNCPWKAFRQIALGGFLASLFTFGGYEIIKNTPLPNPIPAIELPATFLGWIGLGLCSFLALGFALAIGCIFCIAFWQMGMGVYRLIDRSIKLGVTSEGIYIFEEEYGQGDFVKWAEISQINCAVISQETHDPSGYSSTRHTRPRLGIAFQACGWSATIEELDKSADEIVEVINCFKPESVTWMS